MGVRREFSRFCIQNKHARFEAGTTVRELTLLLGWGYGVLVAAASEQILSK